MTQGPPKLLLRLACIDASLVVPRQSAAAGTAIEPPEPAHGDNNPALAVTAESLWLAVGLSTASKDPSVLASMIRPLDSSTATGRALQGLSWLSPDPLYVDTAASMMRVLVNEGRMESGKHGLPVVVHDGNSMDPIRYEPKQPILSTERARIAGRVFVARTAPLMTAMTPPQSGEHAAAATTPHVFSEVLRGPSIHAWTAKSDTKVYHDLDVTLSSPRYDWAMARLNGLGDVSKRLAEWIPRKTTKTVVRPVGPAAEIATAASSSPQVVSNTHEVRQTQQSPSLAWWDRLRYSVHGKTRLHMTRAVLQVHAQVLRPSFLSSIRSCPSAFAMVQALVAKGLDAREHCDLGFMAAIDAATIESSSGEVTARMHGYRVSSMCKGGDL